MGFWGCNKSATTPEGQVNGGAVADEKVNQFLLDKGIQLPAGVERANLAGAEGTGIATKENKEGETTYAVIADLPEPTTGYYVAWLKNENGEVIMLGQLLVEKGGYMVEKTTTQDWSGFRSVIVSKEMAAVTQPTEAVLEGAFNQ
jgi:hypothetical protein